MAGDELLKPTLHVEVLLTTATTTSQTSREKLCDVVKGRLLEDYDTLEVGQVVDSLDCIKHEAKISRIEVADYTGPATSSTYHAVSDIQLDVQCYMLNAEYEPDPRRRIKQPSDDEMSQARFLMLPNASLAEAWGSLVFDDALPARLLRYLVRMIDMMSSADLNLSTFNWNRLCLLHGPPGSGKSTLCRALAQKLSIRLGNAFAKALFVEINTNAMLSKYFGESGKQIGAMFERIYEMSQDRKTLVCVVMDEVETIAGSREKATNGTECSDGLRATNQLLTALDRLRSLPNVIVLCTSNLIDAIDPAFLDRVDIKQLIPTPPPAAIYNIFRSCLNELVRSSLVNPSETVPNPPEARKSNTTLAVSSSSPPPRRTTRNKTYSKAKPHKSAVQAPTSSPEPWNLIATENEVTIPTFAEMKVRSSTHPNPQAPAERVWALAKKCEGFSGRTLRRLPILGLAMYTWGGDCSLGTAVSALEKAVEQELVVAKRRKGDVEMGGV